MTKRSVEHIPPLVRVFYVLIAIKQRLLPRRLSREEARLLEHFRALSEQDRIALRYLPLTQRLNTLNWQLYSGNSMPWNDTPKTGRPPTPCPEADITIVDLA